ncbi:hypothetical protein A2961_00740 [Candidatus Woesebacteria bacterium RIFCSPLOWO2_01_FULL_39_21]|uniref:Plasmid stabilization protein n=1 Tax=Candidatus Woesebacteria bacterium RIFCSPLOWO2_01_FULL_39_21 TaxID=1802519 RepID=A0A1F8BMC0_9BACT|nr:MAG: hypothetical protein A2691_02035 [Candidatus Woesebacteria bacterium RIFCSPHIGHO2_01_FULL_39_23]OGM65207.1 MAG: hypothetical protein A2961_00740 [Candidatus Woesebacteria bacterium RIFCSPLOWO2_01_FULL_39_21]
MKIRFDPNFIDTLKKVNVRTRKSFKQRIIIFSKNPYEFQLNNHPLRAEWQGFRSIDVTNDYRAIYTEKEEGGVIIAYFVALGTHKELYSNK